MQVRRIGPDGQPQVIVFDYKKYLDTGDTRILPPLRPLDEIFVPASPQIGNVQVDFDAHTLESHGDAGEDRGAVRVFGEVATSGTYSFKPGMTVMDALLRAGGVTRYAAVEQSGSCPRPATGAVQPQGLSRQRPAGTQRAAAAGTTVFVPHEVEEVKSGGHVVYVMGEVAKPGAFEARPGTGFFDILANAGGPTRLADTKQIRIIRENGTVADFDLAAYARIRPAGRAPRRRRSIPATRSSCPEKVQGPEQSSWLRTPPSRAVRVMGAVRSPGRFDWSDEMSLVDLIAQAGGPNDHGDISHVEIVQGDRGTMPSSTDLQNFLANGGSAASLPDIHSGYTITVPELPQSPNDTRATWMQLSSDRSIYVPRLRRPSRPLCVRGEAVLSRHHFRRRRPDRAADLLNIRVSHRGRTARPGDQRQPRRILRNRR